MNRLLLAVTAAALLLGAVVGLAATAGRDNAAVVEAVSSSETTAAPAETTNGPPTRAVATTTTVPATTTVPPTTTTTLRIEPQATQFGTPSVPPRPGVRLTLRLDRTSFAVGETLEGTFIIENNSGEDVVIQWPSCDYVHPTLYQHGRWQGGAGDFGRTCSDIRKPPVVVPPGKSHQRGVEFSGYGRPDDGGVGGPLSPGTYQASVAVRQGDDDADASNDVAWFAPSVDVELR